MSTKAKSLILKKNINDALNQDKQFCVGIGASAGGLEALKELVATLPQISGNITYIVAQHLSPNHQSMMVQLLGRAAKLPVEEVQDSLIPEPNKIYITPQNCDVHIQDGMLHLRSPQSEYGPKPSVDYFFSTLADDFGDRAVGIILSGTGSDGSHGMRAIRAAGGLTIVQEPEAAKYDGMPESAIETGCVDLILPTERIGPEVQRIVSSPRDHTLLIPHQAEHTNTGKLLALLKQRSGVDFKNYKSGTLFRRINRRLVASNTFDIDKYISYVEQKPAELDALFQDIMITVTNFFRDAEAFNVIRGHVRDILSRKDAEDPIRIWIPGCATGEEAYSLALLFAEEVGGLANLSNYNLQIFATDIDNEALARARRGIYPEATLENVSKIIKESYFRASDKGFEISKLIREKVIFSRHNVFDDPPFLRQDLISCRNLLIYFENNLQQHVLNLFHYALNPKGILFLGKSEALGQSANLFQPVDSKNKIFQRKLVTSEVRDRLVKSTNYNTPVRPPITATIQSNNKSLHELPDSYIAALAPDSLLVDETLDVVRVYGKMQLYTQLSPGSASMNLMSLARKEFRQELRAMIYRLLQEDSTTNILSKRLKLGGVETLIHIKAHILHLASSPERLILLSFERQGEDVIKKIETCADTDKPFIQELEHELATTREHLQTIVEELETSNEELQSTNEELLTVNEELQVKSSELNSLNEDLQNIKESIDFPIVVVDKELRITRFNQAAKKIFALSYHNKGDLITGISTQFEIADLRANVLSVIKDGKPASRIIDQGDKSYIERIVAFVDENQYIKGAVLTYIDHTNETNLGRQLKVSEERYELATKGANAGIWDWHIQDDKLFCSPVLLQMLKLPKDTTEYTFNFIKHRIHRDDRQDVLAILDAHLERGFEFTVECRLRRSYGDYIWVHLRGQAIWEEKSHKPLRMAGSIYDITERQHAIQQLTRSNEALERFAYVCSHDLKEPVRIVENFVHLFSKQYKNGLDQRGHEYLKHIEINSKRIQEMIRDILSYSQIEHKNTNYENVDCNLEIEKVLDNLGLTIKEYDAKISVHAMPIVRADRMQLFQVFLNLISNALKFNNKKEIRITIGVDDQSEVWRFYVKDNGIGMNQEYASQIFKVFKRLNTTEQYSGTGIGLSICQRVIEKHNGKIWVESKPNKGSTFYFTLPKHPKRGIYINEENQLATTG